MVKTEIPDKDQIEKIAQLLRRQDFLYLASFTDAFHRYMDIMNIDDKLIRFRWGVLSLLISRGGELTHGEIAKSLFRSKHSITSVVDGLEKNGFVIRQARKDVDRRIISVKITQKGLDFITGSIKYGRKIGNKLLTCLDENEQKTLIIMAKRLRKKIVEILNNFQES
jgi:DNA-binding MarR family transcriptional regulator